MLVQRMNNLAVRVGILEPKALLSYKIKMLLLQLIWLDFL